MRANGTKWLSKPKYGVEGRESMMTLAGEHDGAPSRWPMVKFEKGDVVP